MSNPLSDQALDQLFREARTHNKFLDKPVGTTLLQAVYDLMRFGPTSANCCPARIVFVTTQEGKERLKPLLSEGNRAKTMAAPVCAIIGHDAKFYDQIPKLFPHAPGAREWFAHDQAFADVHAFRNGSLQGAYFMLAARALGLDCGPMSGFNNAGVDAAFFAGTDVKSNFLCNVGYGDASALFPRNPRLAFDEACRIA